MPVTLDLPDVRRVHLAYFIEPHSGKEPDEGNPKTSASGAGIARNGVAMFIISAPTVEGRVEDAN